LQAILDSMGEGGVYSEDFTIRYINWRVTDMLGYSADEIQTLLPGLFDAGSVLQNAPPFESFATMLYELNENRLWRGEFRVRRRDGSAMDLNLIVSLVSLPGVRPVRAVTLPAGRQPGTRPASPEGPLHRQTLRTSCARRSPT
jgi:PAS domain S-box-containing protein